MKAGDNVLCIKSIIPYKKDTLFLIRDVNINFVNIYNNIDQFSYNTFAFGEHINFKRFNEYFITQEDLRKKKLESL
ncbi:hypothetical protein M0Q50_05190 [bacterium]|jgi:hypothetical protein|nr:hypothetical protein [bacterium]